LDRRAFETAHPERSAWTINNPLAIDRRITTRICVSQARRSEQHDDLLSVFHEVMPHGQGGRGIPGAQCRVSTGIPSYIARSLCFARLCKQAYAFFATGPRRIEMAMRLSAFISAMPMVRWVASASEKWRRISS